MPSAEPVHVAIVGMGTVGTGVARVLMHHTDRMTRRAGRPVVLRRAVVRDLERVRNVELTPGVLTTDVSQVVNDPQVSVAVHLIGGIHPAREIMLELLQAGKDVVTANKALLCEHGDELFAKRANWVAQSPSKPPSPAEFRSSPRSDSVSRPIRSRRSRRY